MASYLMDSILVKRVRQLLAFNLEGWRNVGIVKHNDVWVVILDPTVKYSPDIDPNDAVLEFLPHGNPNQKYKDVALSKAAISWRTGLPSHLVQQAYPYLWEYGDTKWGGSAAREGLVVACSGLPWQWDWCISNMCIDIIQAFALTEMRDIAADEDINFLT